MLTKVLTRVSHEYSLLGANDRQSVDAREAFTVGIHIYRFIRLLNDLHNIAFGSLFVPIIKLICFLVLFVSTYATFKLRSVMSPVVFSFFLVYMLNVFVATFPGAVIMSKIFYLSSQFQIQQAGRFTRLPQISGLGVQRQLRSFPTLQSQVGPFYHMEGKAKLALADNMTHGIAFMLFSFN